MFISIPALAAVIALTGVVVGLVFNVKSSNEKNVDKIKGEGFQEGKIFTKLDEIGSDVKDIKFDITETKKDVGELKIKVAENEKDIQALHERMDRHTKKENRTV